MRSGIYLLILLVLVNSTLLSQTVKVNFVIHAKTTNDSDKIYIAGNNESLGNWNPGIIRLDKINDTTWTKSFEFNKGTQLEFKFTRGDWNKEALDKNGFVPQNHLVYVKNDTTLYYEIKKWKDESGRIVNASHTITGDVRIFKNLNFGKLKPRNIIVWLPPCYNQNSSKRYPVLYMQDGQNLFDATTSAFGVEWRADETADSLIKNKIVSPFIIVGIYNTSDRTEEYTLTPKGIEYMKFIVTKLKPFIDKTFRTLPDNDNTAVGGSSYGGTISFLLAWNFPEVFSKAALFSPAFKTDRFDLSEKIINEKGKKDIVLYIDNGGVGLEEKLQPEIDEMIEVLKQKGFKQNENLFYYKAPEAKHFEADWAERFWQPLVIFYGKELPEIFRKEYFAGFYRLEVLLKAWLIPDKQKEIVTFPTFSFNLYGKLYGFSEENFPYFFISGNVEFSTLFVGLALLRFGVGPELYFNHNRYLRLTIGNMNNLEKKGKKFDNFVLSFEGGTIGSLGNGIGLKFNMEINAAFENEIHPWYNFSIGVSF